MNIWNLTIIGIPIFFISLLALQISRGQTIVPFGLMMSTLWCSLVMAGIVRLPFAMHEIYLLKTQKEII
jgi:hypothetical protein